MSVDQKMEYTPEVYIGMDVKRTSVDFESTDEAKKKKKKEQDHKDQ